MTDQNLSAIFSIILSKLHIWTKFNKQNPQLLSQNKLLLSQTPVCFLILVFSASKRSFCFLKPQFTFSFWCFPQVKEALTYSKEALTFSFWYFPQVKSALTYSNPSLLSDFGVFCK
ncbi:hypothetical protein [Nostoc favosum]|uniref:Uncharacterized protein n=1 Tax=Nostoc favosum CHAB5714 TaxID=2780399 RepID=A0ABS8I7B8_9NOSO|nr:hypothetical protein [Nostoc favosum]MCC5599916.1 hypothetical protein [Nostoc favosum CHAB5714]